MNTLYAVALTHDGPVDEGGVANVSFAYIVVPSSADLAAGLLFS